MLNEAIGTPSRFQTSTLAVPSSIGSLETAIEYPSEDHERPVAVVEEGRSFVKKVEVRQRLGCPFALPSCLNRVPYSRESTFVLAHRYPHRPKSWDLGDGTRTATG